MNAEEIRQLEKAIGEITGIAERFGLDFFPMRYEICPADIIYTFGAYGMPTRFAHWSFGKTFHKMKMQYDLGLSKIYELVINSDPCYAFLMEGNSLIQNKLIVAHVLAHSDFFKNNARFSRTHRDMVDSMAATAERIREYEMEHGTEEVERFIDAVLAIQEHVDASLIRPPRRKPDPDQHAGSAAKRAFGPGLFRGSSGGRARPSSYDDLWELDQPADSGTSDAANVRPASPPGTKPFPPQPEKDLLLFLVQHSGVLEDWQRDILTVLRDEMLYFWPQIETKIMNEGWASYWHIRIMRELDLTPDEAIEYAKLNASVVQPSRYMLNPYYLGLKIFEDIEERWGRDKIFEVRELDSDISFLRNFLTKDLVEELDLFVFQKEGAEWRISDKQWENVRDQLVYSRVNGGFPYLVVENGDYEGKGDLYLKHRYEGIELDIKYLEKTLPYVQQLWGKRVHLETVVEDRTALFTYDGNKHYRRFL